METLYPWNNKFPFPPPPVTSNHVIVTAPVNLNATDNSGKYLFSCAWLISPNEMLSGFTHVVENGRVSLLLQAA
jgi:hypothetical protein